MKKSFAILVMILCGCCGMAQIDTVHFGDSCWLFNNDASGQHRIQWGGSEQNVGIVEHLDSISPDGFIVNVQSSYFTSLPAGFTHACAWGHFYPGGETATILQEFVLEEPTDLYGIAITMGVREEKVHDPISAVLYIKNDAGQMQRLDSVPWNPSWHMPHARFEYVATYQPYSNQFWNHGDTLRTYAPVYKYYFDTPHYGLTDTIYVGFHLDCTEYPSNYIPGDHSQVMFGIYEYDYTEEDDSNNPYFQNQTCWMSRPLEGPWYIHTGDSSFEANQWEQEYNHLELLRFFSDAVFPIVEPNVVDTIPACDVPENLHIMMQNGDYLILEWAEVSHSLGYQLSYGDFRNDPDSNHIETIGINRKAFRIDTGIFYAARVRSQCLHSCPVHDTLVWSDWSDPVFFFAGTMPDTNTVGIVEVKRLDVTLCPNPTSGKVKVVSSETIRDVKVFDMSGKEVLAFVASGKSLEIDMSVFLSGAYVLEVETERGVATRKLIVER